MGFREAIERTVYSEKEKKERRPQNAPKLDTAGTEPRCSATGDPLSDTDRIPNRCVPCLAAILRQ
jgi:hypothetical protein